MFSEEIRSSNFIAADPKQTSCIVIDRELVTVLAVFVSFSHSSCLFLFRANCFYNTAWYSS